MKILTLTLRTISFHPLNRKKRKNQHPSSVKSRPQTAILGIRRKLKRLSPNYLQMLFSWKKGLAHANLLWWTAHQLSSPITDKSKLMRKKSLSQSTAKDLRTRTRDHNRKILSGQVPSSMLPIALASCKTTVPTLQTQPICWVSIWIPRKALWFDYLHYRSKPT